MCFKTRLKTKRNRSSRKAQSNQRFLKTFAPFGQPRLITPRVDAGLFNHALPWRFVRWSLFDHSDAWTRRAGGTNMRYTFLRM